ncbi:hypothetical protein COV18_04675 [Candidatus Woesearchaeota archaeon CG10_big_fil_rev_8_21_14_0_10_37_12]|nr:MAG: hypothetical protein COV18_04675 [Candidatus Woesearchaeota archaeon CG10_big_fil_rev_8_21_14_0_10_37_12]
MPEKSIHPKSRKAWRSWLEKNHLKEKKVYLIKYKKHTGKPTIANKEAMEEAICFGWIDTTVKRLDDYTYQQCFMRRTDNSRWSNNTLKYAKEMIEQRKMSAEGLKRYNEGLQKPVIDHSLPKNPDVPEDLKKALEKSKEAKENFNNFAPSTRKVYIYWIEKAKRPETRKKRIEETVRKSAENKKW